MVCLPFSVFSRRTSAWSVRRMLQKNRRLHNAVHCGWDPCYATRSRLEHHTHFVNWRSWESDTLFFFLEVSASRKCPLPIAVDFLRAKEGIGSPLLHFFHNCKILKNGGAMIFLNFPSLVGEGRGRTVTLRWDGKLQRCSFHDFR